MTLVVDPSDDVNSARNSSTVGDSEPDIQKGLGETSVSDLNDEEIMHIYSFLNRREQCKMSTVCRRWSELYREPRFWRTITLNLPDSQYGSLSEYPEIAWVENHGSLMRLVEINFLEYFISELDRRQLHPFLRNLSHHAELNSVVLRYFCCFRDVDFFSVLHFFKSQHKLTSVEFRGCIFGIFEARDMLRTVCEGNRETLRKLDLCAFFRQSSNLDMQFFYEALVNINTLVIDYCMMYETIMIGFAKFLDLKTSQKGTIRDVLLESIRISGVEFFQSGLKGVPPEVWLLVKKACPKLSVDIIFEPGAVNDTGLTTYPFLRRHIPLKYLKMTVRNTSEITYPVDSVLLFGHLADCGFNDTLQELSVVWMQQDANFTQEFATFTTICRKLTRVKLSIQSNVPKLCRVFQIWAESRPPALKAAQITVTRVLTEDDRQHYTNLAEFHGPTLHTLGLRLDMIVDRGTF